MLLQKSGCQGRHQCAQRWWCELLLGMVHERGGRSSEAASYFRSALPDADPALAALLTGIGDLLEGEDRSAYRRLTGRERRLASDGPGSFPVVLPAAPGDTHPVFQAVIANRPVAVGIESLDEHHAAARARGGLLPLDSADLVLSDPLLVTPAGLDLPENRSAAVARTLGTTTIEAGDEFAVYWEVYGCRSGSATPLFALRRGRQSGTGDPGAAGAPHPVGPRRARGVMDADCYHGG